MKEGEGATESAAAEQTLTSGEIVADKYRIERLIGSGGMAEVYSAVNIRTDRRVALKWILPVLATSREVMLRFRREALAAGRISHPSVVTIFDVVEHQGSACMVMELLHGEMLSDRLLRTGPLPFADAIAIVLPAMRGVAAAHAQGVIHRDLKPHNIFLCLDGAGLIQECKVLDFGVSKLTVADAATSGDITLSGNVVGTPEYMAPEQVRATKEIDHRIDVYSLGIVLYEMLAGRPPFVNQHFSGLMLEIMQNAAPPLSDFRPDVPRRLAGVIQRAMAKDPERRFADVPAFIQALELVAREDLGMHFGTPPEGVLMRAGLPQSTPPPQLIDVGLADRDQLVRTIAATAFLVLGVAAFVGAWWWRSNRVGREVAHAAPGPVLAPARVASVPIPVPSPPPLRETPPVPVSPPSAALPSPVAALPTPAGSSTPKHERMKSPQEDRRPAGGGTGLPGSGTESAGGDAAKVTTPTNPPAPQQRPSRAGKLTVDDF